MAYEKVNKVNIEEFTGLSTDAKPTSSNIGVDSTYYEEDTGILWKYGANVNPATSDRWWSLRQGV